MWSLARSAGQEKRYFVAAGVAVDKHLALERHDGDNLNLVRVDAWLAWAMRGGTPAG